MIPLEFLAVKPCKYDAFEAVPKGKVSLDLDDVEKILSKKGYEILSNPRVMLVVKKGVEISIYPRGSLLMHPVTDRDDARALGQGALRRHREVVFSSGSLRGKSLGKGLRYVKQSLDILFARLVGYIPGGRTIARRMLARAPKKVARELAVVGYKLSPYEGPVTIFRVSERRWPGRRDPHEIWQRHLRGGITFVELPGDHGTMLKEPHVQELARRISEHLPPADPD